MWYIYKIDDKVKYSLEKPEVNYFTVIMLPPKPPEKYIVLQADFKNKKVWWERRELTEEEQKEERIIAIKQRLVELDSIVKRIDEEIIDELYTVTGYLPYSTIQDAMNEKESLREELYQLTHDGGEIDESN